MRNDAAADRLDAFLARLDRLSLEDKAALVQGADFWTTIQLPQIGLRAMTLSEVTAWGIPAILVPYPWATADHQTTNARALETAGAAVTMIESNGAASGQTW